MASPTIEERVKAQVEPGKLLYDLGAIGLSYEKIAVEMGKHLAGANPSVQSLRRWKMGKTTPSRMNGAALALVHQEFCGESP